MFPPPFLLSIATREDADPRRFPFTLASFRNGINLEFDSAITFLLGENGSGKSTILEAIAECAGFPAGGGNQNHHYQHYSTESTLASSVRLAWRKKTRRGFFLRAESFYNFATYIESLVADDPGFAASLGGSSLHHQSHGESFLTLFTTRFNDGLFILDEPEAALSPQRQLALMKIVHDLAASGSAQFIIATHSPVLMGTPGAKLLWIDDDGLSDIEWAETPHYQIVQGFLEHPKRYLRHLLETKE